MTVRIFINERPIDAEPGESLGSVLRRFDAPLAQALEAGRARATDGVGLDAGAQVPITAGAIFRVFVSARSDPTD